MAKNEVRIIGGKWKGRKLSFPAEKNLRPTLGRVRETLFNWLTGEIRDACCLDLYAGSGALGFEALSRGAAHVTFVEPNRRTAKTLKENLETLDALERTAVMVCSAEQFLRRADIGTFDMIFIDPPFATAASIQLALDAAAKRLGNEGLIYLEQPVQATFDFPGWQLWKSSQAGATRFGLLAREN